MRKQSSKHPGMKSGLVRTLALTLLLCSAAATLPFAAFADRQLCQLACCRGHAPHAAGSCMDGACAAMLIPPRKSPVALKFQPGEKLCGFSHAFKRLSARSISRLPPGVDQTQNSGSEGQTRLAATALSNPCGADCGGCLSLAFNSKRFRTAAALNQDDRGHPAVKHFTNISRNLLRQRSSLCRFASPRGPPVSAA